MSDIFPLPTVLKDPDLNLKETLSLIVIEKDNVFEENPPLFYLPGAKLVDYAFDRNNKSEIVIRSKTRCDVEDSYAYVASFVLDSLQLFSTSGNVFNFTAWIKEQRYYKDISNMVDSSYDYNDEDEVVYNYLPPVVTDVPFKAKIKVLFTDKVSETLESYMENYRDIRAEKIQKAEEVKEERKKREIEQLEDEKQWLRTEEGQDFLVEKKFNDLVKTFYSKESYTLEKTEEITDTLVKYAINLSLEDQERLKRSLNNRLYTYPSKYPSIEGIVREVTKRISSTGK